MKANRGAVLAAIAAIVAMLPVQPAIAALPTGNYNLTGTQPSKCSTHLDANANDVSYCGPRLSFHVGGDYTYSDGNPWTDDGEDYSDTVTLYGPNGYVAHSDPEYSTYKCYWEGINDWDCGTASIWTKSMPKGVYTARYHYELWGHWDCPFTCYWTDDESLTKVYRFTWDGGSVYAHPITIAKSKTAISSVAHLSDGTRVRGSVVAQRVSGTGKTSTAFYPLANGRVVIQRYDAANYAWQDIKTVATDSYGKVNAKVYNRGKTWRLHYLGNIVTHGSASAAMS